MTKCQQRITEQGPPGGASIVMSGKRIAESILNPAVEDFLVYRHKYVERRAHTDC